MNYQVFEVTNKKLMKEFVQFPLKLYKGNKHYIPCLYMDEIALRSKKNYYNIDNKSVFFLVKDENNDVVGRIQGIISYASNLKWNQTRVRFTRFDSINSVEVSNMLFDAIKAWAKQNGMNEIVGPLGYSDLEREGLLIEGFNVPQTFEEQYNYPYYQELIEHYGFKKEADWVESRLYLKQEENPLLETLPQHMLEQYNLHFTKSRSVAQFIRKYGVQLFKVIDETYSGLYQTCPFNDKVRDSLMQQFKLICNKDEVYAIVDKDENIVAFGFCFAGISDIIHRHKGHLTPLAIIEILHRVRHPKVLDLALIGVVPQYAKKGVSVALIKKLMDAMKKYKVEYCETNLNLEDNHAIQNLWKYFDQVEDKRRRSFLLPI